MASPGKPDDAFRIQDHAFVALVDGAFADSARRSGSHLLCRPGCTQCCFGVFAIGPADALRLSQGFTALQNEDPEQASRVQRRATDSWTRLASHFPGDTASGLLITDSEGQPATDFDDFANEEPCPALDPEHGTCDLYVSRPQTCRVFGPPVALQEGFGMCELCFQHATAKEIAAAAIDAPSDDLSTALDRTAIEAGQPNGSTIVAFVLKK